MDDTLKIIADIQVREIAGNKCLLCGKNYTDADYDDTTYVGEGDGGRSVHGACWKGFQLLCDRLGLVWIEAVSRKQAERDAKRPPLGKRPEWLQE